MNDVLTDILDDVNCLKGYEKYPGMIEFTPLHQLVSVMPLKSINLIPKELHKLYKNDSIIKDMFPSKYLLEDDEQKKDHERVIYIPKIDKRRIYEALEQITFSADILSKWYKPNSELLITNNLENKDDDNSKIELLLSKEADYSKIQILL